MVTNNFELERGNPSEKVHLSVEDYKNITNFEESKTLLQDIKTELPETPDITSFKKLMINRDEKIQDKYEDRIYNLEKENNFLKKVINTLQQTVEKFIHWICRKFSVSEEDELIRDFEFENDTFIDPVKQIEHEEELEYEEMEW